MKGKREQIGLAQLRRGVTLFQLGRVRDSLFAFEKAKEIIPKDNMLASWLLKAQMALEKENEEECTISEIPSLEDLEPSLQNEIVKIKEINIMDDSMKTDMPIKQLSNIEKPSKTVIRYFFRFFYFGTFIMNI